MYIPFEKQHLKIHLLTEVYKTQTKKQIGFENYNNISKLSDRHLKFHSIDEFLNQKSVTKQMYTLVDNHSATEGPLATGQDG